MADSNIQNNTQGNPQNIQSTEIPIPQTQPNNSNVVPPPHSPKRPILFAIGAIVILIIVALVAIVFLSNKKNQTNQTAQPTPKPFQNNTLLATVGEKQITFEDVMNAAKEQYTIQAIDNAVMKTFLNILIEQAILDNEAKKLNITLTEAQIKAETNGNNSEGAYTIAKYNLLKEKIMQRQVKNVTAFTIDYWIPPYIEPQVPEYAIQRAEGAKALNEIETKFRAGESPTVIAKYISDTYPALNEILALNGYIYSKTTNQTYFTTPKIYTFDPEFVGAGAYSAQLYDTLATLKENDVAKIIKTDGSGGIALKVISVERSGYTTYDDFLAAKKKEEVKIINNI